MDKKQEILEAAFELFSKKGDHLSMSELAGAVGIKTPSLYSHFSGKDQILELMVHEEIGRYFDCLDTEIQAAESMSCKDAMKSLYLFVMAYFSDLRRLRFWRLIPLISNEALRVKCSSLIARQDEIYNKRMRRCFQKGVESGELRPGISENALYLYLVMIQGILDGMLLYPKNTGESKLAENVFEAYWESVCATSR